MLDEASWIALGVAATLLGEFIAHKLGWIQISVMKKAHQLNINLATPKIGATVIIERQAISPTVYRYFLLTTIYNEGRLAAEKINGNWNLSCSDSGQNRVIPISRDFLGQGSPYELKPEELGGNVITNAINSNQVRINVDIDFTYVGLAQNQLHKYNAKYQYDSNRKKMVRKDE